LMLRTGCQPVRTSRMCTTGWPARGYEKDVYDRLPACRSSPEILPLHYSNEPTNST
jgi:hypothetical protein